MIQPGSCSRASSRRFYQLLRAISLHAWSRVVYQCCHGRQATTINRLRGGKDTLGTVSFFIAKKRNTWEAGRARSKHILELLSAILLDGRRFHDVNDTSSKQLQMQPIWMRKKRGRIGWDVDWVSCKVHARVAFLSRCGLAVPSRILYRLFHSFGQ